MTEEITEAIRNAFNEYLNAVDKIILENQALQIELQRLEQENKEFEILAKSLYKRIEELEKENEALAFRERLYKADYEASEQENKELKDNDCEKCKHLDLYMKYKSALEEIKECINTYIAVDSDFINSETYLRITDKINECCNKK